MSSRFPKEFLLGNVEKMIINYSKNESLYLRFDKSYIFQYEGIYNRESHPVFRLYDKDNLILYQNDMKEDNEDYNILLNQGKYSLFFIDYDLDKKIGFSLINSNNEIEYKFEFVNYHFGWDPRFLRFYNEYKCLFKTIV